MSNGRRDANQTYVSASEFTADAIIRCLLGSFTLFGVFKVWFGIDLLSPDLFGTGYKPELAIGDPWDDLCV